MIDLIRKKKKDSEQNQAYNSKIENLMCLRNEIAKNMEKLSFDIYAHNDLLELFEKGSPDYKAELTKIKELKYSLLCKVGAYDDLSQQVTELNHVLPIRTSHEYLRIFCSRRNYIRADKYY